MSSMMKRPSKVKVLKNLAGVLFTTLCVGGAHAQADWPNRPVKIIVPFGAGSATDITARAVGDELTKEFGQPFVVDNRAGGSGFIGAVAAARAAPDGYTLFVTATTTQSTNPALFKKLPYDPVADFAPVSGITQGYYFLAVAESSPARSAAELVSWLKANPSSASYGWGATVSQVAGAAFLKEVGATAAGVPYKSSPQAMTDLISGQLTFMVQDFGAGLPQLKNGRLKALMVSTKTRVPNLPDIPTGAEAGVPGFDAATFIGMLAPAATPEPIIKKLNAALQRILREPAMAQKMDTCCGAHMFPTTPAEFGEFLKNDRIGWANKIRAAGIEPQ